VILRFFTHTHSQLFPFCSSVPVVIEISAKQLKKLAKASSAGSTDRQASLKGTYAISLSDSDEVVEVVLR
jgi:hypothetical protein